MTYVAWPNESACLGKTHAVSDGRTLCGRAFHPGTPRSLKDLNCRTCVTAMVKLGLKPAKPARMNSGGAA